MDPLERLDLITEVLSLINEVSAKGTPDREGRLSLGVFKGGELIIQLDKMMKPARLITTGTIKLNMSQDTVRRLQPDFLTEIRDAMKQSLVELE